LSGENEDGVIRFTFFLIWKPRDSIIIEYWKTQQLVMPIEVTPYNSIHMMWLLPQYFIITAGEVMFSVTGLQFSFTQVQWPIWDAINFQHK
jgi:dipeptide/tripeptide permease